MSYADRRLRNTAVRLSMAREPSLLELPIPLAALLCRLLAVRRSIHPSRHRSFDPIYEGLSRCDDRSRGSVGNCKCEFFLLAHRCRSGPGVARCIFRLLRAAFAPAGALAKSKALFLCF